MRLKAARLSLIVLLTAILLIQCRSKTIKKNVQAFGIVKVNFEEGAGYYAKVAFYKDSDLKNLVYTLNGYDGADSLKMTPFQSTGDGSSPILYFRCLDSTTAMYKVVTIDSVGTSLWIIKQPGVSFRTWLAYFNEFSGIEYTDLKIHTGPGDSCSIDTAKGLCTTAKILSIKGDWMRIQTNEYCSIIDNETAHNTTTGWVKWRVGHKILVQGYFNE